MDRDRPCVGDYLIVLSLVPLVLLLFTWINREKLGVTSMSPQIIAEAVAFAVLFVVGIYLALIR